MNVGSTPEIVHAATAETATASTGVSSAKLAEASGSKIAALGKGLLPTVGVLAHLGILWVGMKMIVTGKRPKILGGK